MSFCLHLFVYQLMHDSTDLVRQSLEGARAGARSDAWRALRWGQLPKPEMRSEGLWESLSNSLFAFAQKTFLKKSTARDTARTSGLWRNLSSTCRQVYPVPHVQLSPESRNALAHNIARLRLGLTYKSGHEQCRTCIKVIWPSRARNTEMMKKF